MSLIGSSQAAAVVRRTELPAKDHLGSCFLRRGIDSVSFVYSTSKWTNSRLRFTLKASQTDPLRSDSLSSRSASSNSKSQNGVRLFVGLPLDAVSDGNTVKHARAIAVGLKAMKLLGVEGVELPIWWGVVEKEAMGKYDWSSYLSIAEMVQSAGLKLHVSLCFHADEQHNISLPQWISRIGESDPDIFFKDRSGVHCKECLSFAADDLPVLNGKTPIQVYQEFCESFKSSFSRFMGSTLTGITMGLGPDGELRYPSHRKASKGSKVKGAGEFQCYDKNMLNLLKLHAESTGNPLWGKGGPHDAPSYTESPISNGFFKDNGGTWESSYGDFFLSWYSSQLLSHGDRLLSLASATFGDVAIYAKIPLMYSWYKTRSRSSELTAGFYNTTHKDDGYDVVSEMFARHSCKMILPGMDLSDESQPRESLSSPESLLSQIQGACRKFGVGISGQNSLISAAAHRFRQIRKNLSGENVVDLFTYQRMGADFFSPGHFRPFTEFVRNLDKVEMLTDDLLDEEEAVEMQTA